MRSEKNSISLIQVKGYAIRICLFQLAFQTLISKFSFNISIERESNCEKTIFEKMRRESVVTENEIVFIVIISTIIFYL